MHPDISKYIQTLEALDPIKIDMIDDSESHAGHSGFHGDRPSHLQLHIVSDAFIGMNRIARHRLVYDMLKDWMPNPIHALVINAKTSTEK